MVRISRKIFQKILVFRLILVTLSNCPFDGYGNFSTHQSLNVDDGGAGYHAGRKVDKANKQSGDDDEGAGGNKG